MLIASKFARPDAPIELGDRTYFFRPGNPNARPDEHVCEVTDNTHIQRLLSIQEGYYIPEPVTPPQAAVRPQVPATDPAGTNPGDQVVQPTDPAAAPGASIGGQEPQAAGLATAETVANDGESAGTGQDDALDVDAEEIKAAASKLLELHWQKVIAQLKAGGIPKAVLQEALRQENARSGDDEPRGSVVKALTAAILVADAALGA